MKEIIIRQNKQRCEVWHGDKLEFSGRRWDAKHLAKQLHLKSNRKDPVFNIKKGGIKVEVTYK